MYIDCLSHAEHSHLKTNLVYQLYWVQVKDYLLEHFLYLCGTGEVKSVCCRWLSCLVDVDKWQ